jgi:murein DD-endopeptidase MepM/ murein hydrolase activator NlpD
MRIFLIIIHIALLAFSVKAQEERVPVPDSTLLSDTLIAVNPDNPFVANPARAAAGAGSVFDIYWVTTSIKSGWKSSDSLYIGHGVEPCDTLYPFLMPVDGKFWRGCTSYHSGWDIGCPYGTPIRAALQGKVRFAGYSSGYGKLVIVRHYSGMEVYYAHLSKILVATNQFLQAGDTLGLVGATGRARGNHLHMEFRVCDRALDIADYYVQNDTVFNLRKVFEQSRKQSSPSTAEYHVVVRGDNLWDISRQYGTTVSNLCSLNQISKNSTLRIGQRLKVG